MRATASAPGKVILFGEHAVVYGRPAMAVPVTQVQARAEMEAGGSGLTIVATNQKRRYPYADLPASHPLAAIVRLTLEALGGVNAPDATLTIASSIPSASGLGSGAAVSTAIARALAQYHGRSLPAETVSALVFEVEKIHHGTPSGIDNTVIAFEKPVYFRRAREAGAASEVTPFAVPVGFRIAIGDTGVASPTRLAVGDVRRLWEAAPDRLEALFDRCGQIAVEAGEIIRSGRPLELGRLMNDNHALLREMTVSSPELEALVAAAAGAGALGAKLSGGGRGGNMIALVTDETQSRVQQALLDAGATNVITTMVGP